MKLWLVRHAAPTIEPGICYGRTDVPADPQSTLDAAAALAAALPQGLRIDCSPLQRCERLGQALRALRPDLSLRPDPRLAEMDFGDWEGLRWDALGQPALDAWSADFFLHRPGGGESLQAFMRRVGHCWDQARARHQDCAWITHAGVIRATRLLAGGVRRIDNSAQWPQDALPFGGWELLEA